MNQDKITLQQTILFSGLNILKGLVQEGEMPVEKLKQIVLSIKKDIEFIEAKMPLSDEMINPDFCSYQFVYTMEEKASVVRNSLWTVLYSFWCLMDYLVEGALDVLKLKIIGKQATFQIELFIEEHKAKNN